MAQDLLGVQMETRSIKNILMKSSEAERSASYAGNTRVKDGSRCCLSGLLLHLGARQPHSCLGIYSAREHLTCREVVGMSPTLGSGGVTIFAPMTVWKGRLVAGMPRVEDLFGQTTQCTPAAISSAAPQ